ncbi:uncharacterized protein THITE_2088758 [Thermothielavioides terrestris NRRL 8126]|uniref:Uncharacterized protein n=1 Tax=Thermothielavioides terrestris (strain ATCC 38088 / NRRL 8126) TaxID=578455 RepID=G2R0A2_THETT|nr:uncharacterized protein THITE_2088758 [Thermothielavioides terrestris NRRL 8126]AEO67270.1 hypothetical protein THITE_2088758 [Thermothielavioides terrestris NRRL 8126]
MRGIDCGSTAAGYRQGQLPGAPEPTWPSCNGFRSPGSESCQHAGPVVGYMFLHNKHLITGLSNRPPVAPEQEYPHWLQPSAPARKPPRRHEGDTAVDSGSAHAPCFQIHV